MKIRWHNCLFFARFEAYSLGMKDDCAILQLIKIQKEIDARSRDALANYNKDVVHEKQMAFHRLIPSGMIDNPNIPKGNRFVFVNSPYSGYGDGAVRVGNSIIVGPMEILKQLQKNENKILAKNAA